MDPKAYIYFYGPVSTLNQGCATMQNCWATAACVKLCGLENLLATEGTLTIPFKNIKLTLKSGTFCGPQNFSF